VRILVVSSYPPRHCGIGTYARDHVARLRSEGHDVTVLSAPDGNGDIRVELLGGRAFIRAARIGGGFDRIVVHFQPGLYYRPRAPMSKIATSVALWWLAFRRPVEIVVHEADPPKLWRPDYTILRAAFARARELQFHTRTEWSAFEEAYGLRVRGTLVPHTVRPVGASIGRAEARRSLGVDPSGPVFVLPGFIQPSKGAERILDAFEGEGPVGLFIVGSLRSHTAEGAAYLDGLRRRCEGLPRVHLVERFLDDEEFDRWILAADWVVLPYRRSWSSGVLARAQALGIPSIVTEVGGLREQAGDGDMVVPNEDDAIVRAIAGAAATSVGRRGSA